MSCNLLSSKITHPLPEDKVTALIKILGVRVEGSSNDLVINVTTREEILQAQWRHSIEEPHSFWNVCFENNSSGDSKGTEQKQHRVNLGLFC